jgi:hypothetical protein
VSILNDTQDAIIVKTEEIGAAEVAVISPPIEAELKSVQEKLMVIESKMNSEHFSHPSMFCAEKE